MKTIFLIPLAILISCSSVQNNNSIQKSSEQLLKDVETLASDAYEGRKTGTKGAEMARTYLTSRLKEIGLKPYPGKDSYEHDFEFKPRNGGQTVKGKNLIAYIPGKSENVIVISAHYDHVGVINNEVFNGADDNASGVAGLLQFAKYFSKNKPNNTLIFAIFDAEEMGLQGAKAFVANPPVALDKIKLNVNMDMISHNDKGELYAVGTFKYPELKRFFIITNPNIKVLFGHDDPKLGSDDWTNQSDQGAFNAKNIPFIYFGVEDHKDYHKATDEFKNINKTFFVDAANAIQEIIVNIDKQRDLQAIFKENLQLKKQ
jgi:Zn-dependent M28 family amino/carboxypeptidase